jgi:hypothetical protein
VPFPIDDLHLLISLHHPPPRLLHLPPHPESLWFIGLLLPHPGAFLEPSVGGFSGDLRKIKVSCGTTFRCRRRGHRWWSSRLLCSTGSGLWRGSQRHAHTLHTPLAARGHSVHVFTFPLPHTKARPSPSPNGPEIHFLDDELGAVALWLGMEAVRGHEAEGKNDEPIAWPFSIGTRAAWTSRRCRGTTSRWRRYTRASTRT